MAALVTLATAAVSWAGAPALRRITQGNEGGRPLAGAYDGTPSVSADGRYVAFVSNALDYAPVVSGTQNVFVKDRLTGSLELVNRTLDGGPSSGATNPAISADGRYVAFASKDSALVSGDTNGVTDVFVRDRLLHTTQRISVAVGGGNGDSHSGRDVAISSDGRFVGFSSLAANLVAGDTNGQMDVFIRDRVAGTTERVSPASTGAADFTNVAISTDGRYVAFSGVDPARTVTLAGTVQDLLVRDRETQSLEAVSVSSTEERANGDSYYPSISADGRYVTFTTYASNLVAGGESAGLNVYVRDRLSGTTTLVSQAADGATGPSSGERGVISPDGRLVAFTSQSPNIIPGSDATTAWLYVRDLSTGTVRHADVSSGGALADWQVDLHSRPAFTADGRYLFFESEATNLDSADQSPGSDLFVRDLTGGATALVSTRADGSQGVTGAASSAAVISADGSTVAFLSNAHNLVPNDQNHAWDVFVTTRNGEAPELISVSTEGAQAQQDPEPFSPTVDDLAISADGRFVAFVSAAPNLVGDDHNGTWDVFVRDRLLQTTVRADVSSNGVEANDRLQRGRGRNIAISADGRYVAFVSSASNLVPGDTSNYDVFVRDLLTQTTEKVSVAPGGAPLNGSANLPSLSADGRFVSFVSDATNLVPGNTDGYPDVYRRDRLNGITERVSLTSTGERVLNEPRSPSLSADGRYLVFASSDDQVVPGDTNGADDVFVRDIQEQTTQRVSLGFNGEQLVGSSRMPAISADGRFVSFRRELDSGGYAVLVRDRQLQVTERADINADGSGGWDARFLGSSTLSGDGHYIAFTANNPSLDVAHAPGEVDVFVRTRAIPANAPGSLNASVEGRNIRLNWVDQSDDETAFRVQRRKGDGTYQTLATLPPDSTEYLDTSVEWDAVYTYRVYALSPGGDSPFSNEASATVGMPIPDAPTGLTAVPLSRTSIRLEWHDASDVESGYSIERSIGNSPSFEPVTELAANQQTYTDTGLTPGTLYTYRVRATNASGSSSWVTATATTLPNPPQAPAGFAVSLISDTSMRIVWSSASHDETGFRLERKAAGESFQQIREFPAGSTGFNDTGLQPASRYTYRIQAYNAGGASEWVERSATTADVPKGKLDVVKKLDFGSVKIGKTADRNLKIRNLSPTESLRAVLEVPAVPFSLVQPPIEVFLYRRGMRDTLIRFKPTAKGKQTVQLKLVSSDPKRPEVTITLTGRGK